MPTVTAPPPSSSASPTASTLDLTKKSGTCSPNTVQNLHAKTGPPHSRRSTTQSKLLASPRLPKESRIVKAILTRLNKLTGTWAFKVHGGPYQAAGLPDVVCVSRGHVVFLEVKRPGGKVSRIQERVHAQLRSAGACVHVVESVDEALDMVARARPRKAVEGGIEEGIEEAKP